MKDEEKSVDVSTLENFNLLPIWEKKEKKSKPEKKGVFHKEKKSGQKRRERKQSSKKHNLYFYTIFPNQETIQKVRTKIKENGITYSLKEIANVLAEKKERLCIKIKSKNQNVFWKSKRSNAVYTTKEEAVLDLIFTKENNQILCTIENESTPTGNFSHVLKCPHTNKLIPSTNFHNFKQIVEHHLYEESLKVPAEEFVNKLIKVDDRETVEQWKKESIKIYSYRIGQKSNARYNSISKLKTVVNEDFEKYFYKSDEFTIPFKDLASLPKVISSEISVFIQEKKIWYSQFLAHCLINLKRGSFCTFKKNNEVFIRYNQRKSSAQLISNKLCTLIIQQIPDSKTIQKKDLIKMIKSEENLTKDILLELKWLSKEGYINEYSNGDIDLN
jgi:hypothetical protein